MATYISNVDASSDFVDLLLEPLGYPIIDKTTLFGIYSEEYIKNNIIGSCLEVFFNYFPIIKEFSMAINTTIASPINNVLGIVHYTLNGGSNAPDTDFSSLGAFALSKQTTQSFGGSNYGTPFNYNGYRYSIFQQKFYADSLKQLAGGRKYVVTFNSDDNSFTSVSKMEGQLNVEVGCYSNKVADIPNRLKQRFLDLCKAEIGIKFATHINLVDTDLPLSINSDELLDSSKDLKESTIEWLERNSHVALMK